MRSNAQRPESTRVGYIASHLAIAAAADSAERCVDIK